MKIMVFDVPAEKGGALTILTQYYEKAVKDKSKNWIFVISTPNLEETDNVKVLRFPWVKKSWIHRLYFDRFVAKKIVKTYDVDEVLSLQNVTVPNINIKQTLYLHQPLPFVEVRYRLLDNPKFWLYQNIISRLIFNSVRQADKVIVQTEWMKNACIEKVKVTHEKFELIKPDININVKKTYKQDDNNSKLFFYPSSGLIYKNHRIIIQAIEKLLEHNITNFEVIFTLSGNENKNVKSLYDLVQEKGMPVKFIGKIDIEQVYEYYSKSILLFPSYIETFGLPMLEAKRHKSPILASNCAFSHEILDGYKEVRFFNPFDAEELFKLMLFQIER